jgi:outer membrane protein assembly factor BamD (BamD/ComL family)
MKPRADHKSTLAMVLCIATLTCSCNNPENDLKKAERANTEQAYGEFIKKHPDSPLVDQAQADLEKVAYQAAKHIETPTAFEDFIKRFPKSSLANQAQADLERAAYNQAKQSGTPTAFGDFLKCYPKSSLAKQAQADLERAVYNQAKAASSVTAYESFLDRFSDGEYAPKARSELEGLEFDIAGKQQSIDGWQAFLRRHPQSPHTGAATSNLCALSFKQAADQNSVAALETFLTQFTNSQQAPEALEKLASLLWPGVSTTNTVVSYQSFISRLGNTSFGRQASNALARLEERTARNNAAFQSAVAEYRESPKDESAEKVIKAAILLDQLPDISEDARKHFIRGSVIFKDAKSPTDYEQALDEFNQACEAAPWWREARYNLALACEGKADFANAISNLKLYQLFRLSDAETRQTQDKIYAVQAKLEQDAKRKEREREQAITEKKNRLKSWEGKWTFPDDIEGSIQFGVLPAERVTETGSFSVSVDGTGTATGAFYRAGGQDVSSVWSGTATEDGLTLQENGSGSGRLEIFKNENVYTVVFSQTETVTRNTLFNSSGTWTFKYNGRINHSR